jgi:hypothetical protein
MVLADPVQTNKVKSSAPTHQAQECAIETRGLSAISHSGIIARSQYDDPWTPMVANGPHLHPTGGSGYVRDHSFRAAGPHARRKFEPAARQEENVTFLARFHRKIRS